MPDDRIQDVSELLRTFRVNHSTGLLKIKINQGAIVEAYFDNKVL